MSELKAGDSFRDFVGPLGCASEFVEEDIEELKKQKILFVAGGLGTAPVYPQVKWLHERGIDADVIIGAKTKDLVIMEKEMEAVAGNLYVTTDDGSYGRSGMVTQVIKDLVEKEGKHYDKCVAIGPMIKIYQMSVKLWSVYTCKFNFISDLKATCSTHSCTIYHNRVHADIVEVTTNGKGNGESTCQRTGSKSACNEF